MHADEWIAIAGIVVAAVAFLFGLLQYRKAQIWKRLEFAANEAKEAFADHRVRFALHLLDWNESFHDLRTETGDAALLNVRIADEDLQRALEPHNERVDRFSKTEVHVRLAFDEWLGRLQRYEHFIETELLTPADCWPYLRYWLDLMLKPTEYGKSAALVRTIWKYLRYYRYDDVVRLCRRYGFKEY